VVKVYDPIFLTETADFVNQKKGCEKHLFEDSLLCERGLVFPKSEKEKGDF